MQLKVDSVALAYDRRQVLDGVSLSLGQGQIGCLLGASGCGKTSLLRAIAGFVDIDAGSIKAGELVLNDGRQRVPPEKRQIGMVFQDYALFPHLDVAANVGFGLRHMAASQRALRVGEVLGVVGLANRAHAMPHELSGGQQQRVALARALAPSPDLLLLDEPFSNLDSDLRERLASDIRDILKACDATALLVTHDQQEAFTVADEIGVMRDGKIIQWGSGYELYHEPRNRQVAQFIGDGCWLRGRVTDRHTTQTPLGPLPLPGNQMFAPGEFVDVLLRPDDLQHDDEAPLELLVAAKKFRGAEILYTLALPDGAQVQIHVPSHHDHQLHQAIGVRLEMDHVIAFAAE